METFPFILKRHSLMIILMMNHERPQFDCHLCLKCVKSRWRLLILIHSMKCSFLWWGERDGNLIYTLNLRVEDFRGELFWQFVRKASRKWSGKVTSCVSCVSKREGSFSQAQLSGCDVLSARKPSRLEIIEWGKVLKRKPRCCIIAFNSDKKEIENFFSLHYRLSNCHSSINNIVIVHWITISAIFIVVSPIFELLSQPILTQHSAGWRKGKICFHHRS